MRLALGLLALIGLCAAPLPKAAIPPGKVFMVIQPHHDDHTTDYGMGGLIARLVDEGYRGIYIRASNDEKDGVHGYPLNDQINLKECLEATQLLGIETVHSLNWRNDYMDPIPLQELRAQLILLIRKYRPDVILGHDPWGHYDRNPDHRKVARAMAEAFWMAGYGNVHPEHAALGLRPHRAPFLFLKARVDYGRGHEPNVVVELTEAQVARKQKAYSTHRNVYASPAMARGIRKQLDAEGLEIAAIDGKNDQQAAVLFEEWYMEWISRQRGEENGVRYGEVYWFRDEFDQLPGLKAYLRENAVKR
ncbi:MAG: PIG-L family deacetylase [Bryobacteraceae bacterium]|nr:PIG-L family deacetylase [Bryobacteraceae bacterium]